MYRGKENGEKRTRLQRHRLSGRKGCVAERETAGKKGKRGKKGHDCSDTDFRAGNDVSRKGKRGKEAHDRSDTSFRAGKGVSRKGNGGKEGHGCSDTDFRAGNGVSRKEKRQERVCRGKETGKMKQNAIVKRKMVRLFLLILND